MMVSPLLYLDELNANLDTATKLRHELIRIRYKARITTETLDTDLEKVDAALKHVLNQMRVVVDTLQALDDS